MRQAIVTKYLGPTDFRGSRVKASAEAGSVTLEWDDALNSDENHTRAACFLAHKYGWDEKNALIGGAMPGNEGYCFVLVDKETGL